MLESEAVVVGEGVVDDEAPGLEDALPEDVTVTVGDIVGVTLEDAENEAVLVTVGEDETLAVGDAELEALTVTVEVAVLVLELVLDTVGVREVVQDTEPVCDGEAEPLAEAVTVSLAEPVKVPDMVAVVV